jgi:homoserine O-succinyltransferase
MSGVCGLGLTAGRLFLTGHSEYDPDTTKKSISWIWPKGCRLLYVHYFTDDDPAGAPVVTWRSSAYLIFANWLNYYVYQMTPFDLENLDDVGNAAAESAE